MTRNQVVKLRSRGKTFSEIRKIVGKDIPKSTLSYWCKNVKLPIFYKKKVKKLNQLSSTAGRERARLNRENRRNTFLKNSATSANKYLKQFGSKTEFLKLLLSILYLGEGAKWSGHKGLMLGSSDPRIMNLYIDLLDKCYGIKRNRIKLRVSYRADQDINHLEKYWSKTLGISKDNFYKTKPDPRTAGKISKTPSYKGVCVANCAGVDIQLELDQMVNILLDNLNNGSLK
ncbi:MAG: hypothetical protein WC519_00110 [Parcubacteria group bacterium]